MDDPTRKAIERATLRARRLLTEDFAVQLEGTFDVMRNGTILSQPGAHLTRRQAHQRARIVAAIAHKQAGGMTPAEAVADYLRDAAFTTLNRFAALKMLEARGLVTECLTRGEQSTGYGEFYGAAPGVLLLDGAGYRLYLECLFDELSTEVKVLFNRRDAASLLWPKRACLGEMLAALNAPELAGVWDADETIGWIYQFYNGDDVRMMREAANGGAPRNSRELAVRNQFFTPRYVVEFLTDNTLGRLWYEMTRGETRLKEQCRYLVRYPNEVFLEPGQGAPDAPGRDDLSQEELLKLPVFIAHRPLKDPRTVLMLDPACGSMHFGLYAFDLFTVIYEEAWALEESLGPDAWSREPGMKPLHEEYPNISAFQREIPRLILERNIHGIDIDPRAVQIAALALWLRAQKAWQQQGVRPADRPALRRTQVACAEAMPGEKELLREFVEREFPEGERALFQRLLEAIFDKMQLAGEAGSLLKIEDEIRGAVEEAQAAWNRRRQGTGQLFSGEELNQISRQPQLDVLWDQLPHVETASDAGAVFWEAAETRLLAALREYAEQAENGAGFRRRLFAEDAARGFAFIDICRKRYDVALMNPPFGDASLPSKPYIEDTYGDTKGDVYKAFVECFQSRLIPAGYLGIISSRTGFFLSQSEDWRTRVVLRLFRPIVLADLGSGVLDAMVEVAAYVLRSLSEAQARDLTLSIVPALEKVARDKQDRFSLPKWQVARNGLKRHQAVAELAHLAAHGFVQRSLGDIVRYTPLWHAVKKVTTPPPLLYPPLVCIRALADEDKGPAIIETLSVSTRNRLFVATPTEFAEVPGCPFAYWIGPKVRKLFTSLPAFESPERAVRVGLQTSDDLRFVRGWWEVASTSLKTEWVSFAKGGSTRSIHSQIAVVINWRENGKELKSRAELTPGTKHWSRKIASSEFYFKPGITWPLRASRFSPQAMPRGCIFSIRGQTTIAPESDVPWMLPVMASAIFDALFKTMLGRFGFPEFATRILQRMPWPSISAPDRHALAKMAEAYWQEMDRCATGDALSLTFVAPSILNNTPTTLSERATAWAAHLRTSEETVAAIQAEIDDRAFRLYGIDTADRAALTSTLATESTSDPDPEAEAGEDEEEEAVTADIPALTAELMAYGLGVAFGRWDIRYATGEQAAPELPDPFAPLPVCPPGQLQNAQGLPACPEDVAAAYPVRIPWDGILVDDPNHPLDVERRVREVIEIIWTGSAGPPTVEAIEHEACEILGVKSLRDYFRKPAGFFADHLKRYSKSRRQAPIYWPLATPSSSYTVWLYYHRFDKDTLYKALEHVKEKCLHEEQVLVRMAAEAGASPSAPERKALAAQEEFVPELLGFREELSRVAPLWNPNLNDGVILNYGPLWRMIAHKPWQKAVKAHWDDLVAGKYDWAHLAMHLWPERVVPKCAADRSLAIAHGLEEEFWVQAANGKWQSRANGCASSFRIHSFFRLMYGPNGIASYAQPLTAGFPTLCPSATGRRAA